MQKLAEVCVRRPVFAAMLNLALVVVGIVSYGRLGVDRLPSVDLPTVRVQTLLPGASPEEIETEVSDVVEQAVNTVQGLDELRSISMPNRSVIVAGFDLGQDISVAAQDVRDRVAAIARKLPAEADPPIVAKVDNDADPVMTIAVAGTRSVREISELADKVVRVRLERAKGVGEVRLVGALARTVNVWLDADRLDATALPATAVRDAVAAQNVVVPGGNVTAPDQELTLRTIGRYLEPAGFEDIVVASRRRIPIRVRDLGRAEDGTAEQRTIARLNGKPSVVVEVVRQSGANTVAVIDGVKAALRSLRETLPPDVETVVIRDQSRYIRAALHEINVHLVLGSLLASLVVLAFMGSWRSTLIAAIAIPTSVVATFGVMAALGFTLNSVTMLALVLMVGIVIDDAIVVLENIFRFIEEKGMAPLEAAREATAEIGLAVLATTFSLVVIFVPVSFMSSVAGRFLYQFGITAAVSVLVSLLVSFSLTPMMAGRLLRRGIAQTAAPSSRGGLYGRIDAVYCRLVRWSMRHRAVVVVVALAAALTSFPFYRALGREFVPTDVDEAEFGVSVTAPEGASVAAMDLAMQAVEREVLAVRSVRDVLLTTGGGGGTQTNQGELYVRIAPHEERRFSVGRLARCLLAGRPLDAFRGNAAQSSVMDEVNRRLKSIKGLRCLVRNFPSFNVGGGSWDVNFVIRGPDLARLSDYAEEIRARALAGGGFRGLDTTVRLDKPEVRLRLDRDRAADLGISARDLGTAMRLMVGGDEEVSRFRDPSTNQSYDVRLRLRPEDRERPGAISRLKLQARNGRLVELSSIAAVQTALGPSRVDRLDRERVVSIRGGVAPGFALGDRIDVLRRLAAEAKMPAGYTASVTGRSRELERTFGEFLVAFGLSIVFMYLILASQFESLVHPLTILISLPLAVPFALFSLWGSGGTLNVYSALGILVLFGVVKKNSILQIDHMNGLRRAGVGRDAAILQGNRDRLRPILMTTLALVAGMLPLAVGSGPGAEERRAVAVVVIGGQTLCLLLTLLVTPVAYSLLDDLARWLSRAGEGPQGAA